MKTGYATKAIEPDDCRLRSMSRKAEERAKTAMSEDRFCDFVRATKERLERDSAAKITSEWADWQAAEERKSESPEAA